MAEKLYFTRHGQTVWNVENKICGATDSPLTELGRSQARELGRKIVAEGLPIDRILCSPLSRAADTARCIAEETGLKVGEPDATTKPVHVREGKVLWRVHPFLFRLDAVDPVLNDENEAFEWVSPEDIRSRDTVTDTFLVVDRMLNGQ